MAAKSDAHIYAMQEENMRLQEELRVLAQKRMETQSQKHCNDSATAVRHALRNLVCADFR